MKIIIQQTIQLKTFSKGHKCFTKEFESNIIPNKGDFILDSLWINPNEYQVDKIILDYDLNECYVRVDNLIIECDEKETLDKYEELAKLNDWKFYR